MTLHPIGKRKGFSCILSFVYYVFPLTFQYTNVVKTLGNENGNMLHRTTEHFRKMAFVM